MGGHLLFVFVGEVDYMTIAVNDLQVGNKFVIFRGAQVQASNILSVKERENDRGLYAPLTYGGRLLVNGVVASNYASPDAELHLPHSLAHAFIFPVRLYEQFFLSAVADNPSKQNPVEEFHSFLEVALRVGQVDRIFTSMS